MSTIQTLITDCERRAISVQIIMAKARELVVSSTWPGDEAYERSYAALENMVTQALENEHNHRSIFFTAGDDSDAHLPTFAAEHSPVFMPFNVPDDVEPIHPDMIQMMDDMAQWGMRF